MYLTGFDRLHFAQRYVGSVLFIRTSSGLEN